MAGILTRVKDIMAANVNALLEKAENPEKMIDQYLRNLESDLGKVKAETAAVMASETQAKRKLTECNEEIEKMTAYAKRAIEAGNDNDARVFLEKKAALVEKQAGLSQAYDAAAANAAKMREMHDKLTKDIRELQERKDAIKTKMAVAKTQEKLNKLQSGMASAGSNMAAFDRMEEKANRMLDEANAMQELNSSKNSDPIAELEAKYRQDQKSAGVEDELARMKAEMGLA